LIVYSVHFFLDWWRCRISSTQSVANGSSMYSSPELGRSHIDFSTCWLWCL